MTTQSFVVLALVALLGVYALVLWRATLRRTKSEKSARRAQRLQEQIAWDRMTEDHKSRN